MQPASLDACPPWHRRGPRFSLVGFVLLVVGIWWLGGELHWFPEWQGRFFWPVALIGVGLALIVSRMSRRWW